MAGAGMAGAGRMTLFSAPHLIPIFPPLELTESDLPKGSPAGEMTQWGRRLAAKLTT